MEATERDRVVMTGPHGSSRPGTTFSAAQGLAKLLEASWPERWEILESDPRLVHLGVARACEDVDPLLAMVIRRVDEAGVERARAAFPVALDLVASLSGEGADEVAAGVAAVVVVVEEGLWWLTPLVEQVIPPLTSRVSGQQAKAFAANVLMFFVMTQGGDPSLIEKAQVLAATDWPVVWAQLPQIRHPAELAVVADAIARHSEVFLPGSGRAEAAAELRDILLAVDARGPERAIAEHQAVLTVRRMMAEPLPTAVEQAKQCLDLACTIANYCGATDAKWILGSGVSAGRKAVELTAETHPDYAISVSVLVGLIAMSIEAGTLPSDSYVEAVKLQRRAAELADPTDAQYAGLVSNLGGVIARAIGAGTLPASAYLEAVELLRRALDLTQPTHPIYPGLMSNLGGRIADAITAGVMPARAYVEAVELLRRAAKLTHPTDPSYPSIVVNLGALIAEAISEGVLPGTDAEAIELLRQARERIDAAHPAYWDVVSSLRGLIEEAIRAGILPLGAYIEAIDLQRQVVARADATQLDYPMHVSVLGQLIGKAIAAGLLPGDAYAEAIALERQAVELTGPTHLDYPARLSNLGDRISDAIQAGIVPEADYIEAVHLLRKAVLNGERHPDYPAFISNLGNLIAEASEAGILPRDAYNEALQLQRRAVELTGETHPSFPGYVSNLGNRIAGAIWAGILPRDAYTEALQLQRRAVELTGETHPNYMRSLSNLSNRIADTIQAGILPEAAYAEALDLQRQAMELITPTHPYYPSYASNLCKRISQAIGAGLLLPREGASELVSLVDGLWRAVRQSASSPLQRRAVLKAAQALSALAPAVIVDGLGASEGIRTIESLRNHLIEGQHAPAMPTNTTIPAELADRYRLAARTYRHSQQLVREGLADVVDTSRAMAVLVDSITAIAALPGLDWFGSRPRLSEIADRLDGNTLGVYLIAGTSEGVALLLDRGGEARPVRLPGLTWVAVTEHVGMLLKTPAHAQAVAAWLWTAIMGPVLEESNSAGEWVIVPTGLLGMLPWHAAGRAGLAWLDDQAAVRVIPSLTMLDLPTGPVAEGPPLVGIVTASELRYLEADEAVTAKFLPEAVTIPRDGMHVDAVLRELAEASSAIISGHAQHSLSEGGGLVLADGVLSAELLEDLPIRCRGVAFLSSCSSGQIAAELADESIGLPNALLHAGFRGVQAALWPVSDRTAFLTLACLLLRQSQDPELAPHEQLRQVRRWLRTATTVQLQQWVSELAVQVAFPDESAILPDLQGWLGAYGPQATPLDDPAEWAAFAYIGR